MPKVLAKVHPKHNTPYLSIYLVAVLSLLICYLFIDAVDTLTSLVNFGALSGFMLLHITVINHYWRRQQSGQLIRHLICPLIGFVIVAAIMYNMGVAAQKLGLIWIAAGVIYLCVLTNSATLPPCPIRPVSECRRPKDSANRGYNAWTSTVIVKPGACHRALWNRSAIHAGLTSSSINRSAATAAIGA